MKVANRKCIRNLSIKNMRTARARNRIAVLAIALTTVLFTSLFTIAISVVYAYEQSNFRQVGGYAHGELKRLTQEQFEEFKTEPRFAEYGKRYFVGFPTEAPFNKCQVEVSCVDENYAKYGFADFIEGGLPAEGSREAAADTRVLSLLGVTPKIGAEFTMTFDVAGRETTETFLLSGYWEYDSAMPASNVYLPFSRGKEIIDRFGITAGEDDHTGMISLDFMLKRGSAHIEEDIRKIIEEHGYQCDNREGERYIGYGVNWGYLDSQLYNLIDPAALFAMVALVLLIVFTGYLIIYNVFRISVSNDIRYYGLLKTIGTTGTQIRRIISIQAYALSAAGIPAGLLVGYGVGACLTPMALAQMQGVRTKDLSFSPLIFILSALFSFGTVILSCKKPGRIAAGISPVEAVRYTESSAGKQIRKGKRGAGILKMALANLRRTKGKTVITIISLSLSVLLLNLTVTFAKSFDMDRYIRIMPVDFIVADAGYFNVLGELWNEKMGLPKEAVSDIAAQADVVGMGRVYGCSSSDVWDFVPEDYYRKHLSKYYDSDSIEEIIRRNRSDKDGHVNDGTQLYGMEEFCLGKLKVVDGDITKLFGDGNYIAAVCREDDYGNVIPESHWAKVGDTVQLLYIDGDDYVWIDPQTGEVYGERPDDDTEVLLRPAKYHEAEYEVAATVTVPYAVSYRFYSSESFILGAETFKRDTRSSDILYLAFDGKEDAVEQTEQFLADYTKTVNPLLHYESKMTYYEDFASFRNMFVLAGALLSFIVGLVGVLNFINAVLTGIFARRREFAILQAIGMTGRQLKRMLVAEGLVYTLGAAGSSLLLLIVFSPLSKQALEGMFWFCSFRFTVTPVLVLIPVFAVLGAVIPGVAYRFTVEKSIVERIREAE